MSTDDKLAWLAALDKSIWATRPAEMHYNMSGTSRRYTAYSEKRRVTEGEWKKLVEIVSELNLPCEMTNACMGFGFGVRVYLSSPYPGTPPERLLTVTSDHFSDPTKARPDGDDKSWGRFERLVYSESNIRLLEFNGFGKPKTKSYYDY